MIRINRFMRLALLAVLTLIFSCSEDEDTIIDHGKETVNGKTSLFEVVTEPESTNTNRRLDGIYMDSSEIYSGSASEGSPVKTGDWGDGNPDGH